MPKPKRNRAWFEPVRGSYLPVSVAGFVLYSLYVVYLAALLVGWYVDGHRVWYLLVEVIPLCVASAVVVTWVAARHSR